MANVTHLEIKVCCNNMIAGLKQEIVVLNEVEFCLGNVTATLKEPINGMTTAIVKIHFCPWCGKLLSVITADIKLKMKEAEKGK